MEKQFAYETTFFSLKLVGGHGQRLERLGVIRVSKY